MTPSRAGGRLADAVWLAMSAAAVYFVARFGVNLPLLDEWAAVDVLAGARPVGPWLWEWHNEHLYPLPRLLFWGLFQLTGDLRGGMFFSAAVWVALARLLMLAARRLRGHPALSDAVFPLLLLHFGQYENLLMSYQLGFALSAGLAGLSLVLMLQPEPGPGRVAGVAACTALLPLCGGHGLVLSGAGMLWLAAVAVRGGRRGAAGLLGLAVALGVASLYLWLPGRPPAAEGPDVTPLALLRGLGGFASVGFGPAGEKLWPWLTALPAAVLALAAVAAWRGRERSPAFVGGVGFVAAWLVLAALVAWGRGRFGLHAVFFPRYVALSALLPAAAVLLWLRFGGPRLARLGPAALAAVAALLLPVNDWYGWRGVRWLHFIQESVVRELNDGVPVEVVARKFHMLIYNDPEFVAAAITRYAGYGIGPVRGVRHEPPTVAVPLPTTPTRLAEARAVEHGILSTGRDAWIEFDLPAPRRACAVVVRGRYRYPGVWPPARVWVEWWREPGGEVRRTEFPLMRLPTPALGDPAIVVWVDDVVAGFRFAPDDPPWGFAVEAVELRVRE